MPRNHPSNSRLSLPFSRHFINVKKKLVEASPNPRNQINFHRQSFQIIRSRNLTWSSTIQRIIWLQDMDTSNPAVFVNAELLPMYVGRRVRAVIQVLRSEGGTIVGKSTDERQLIIKGSPPPSPLTTFVEVIGIADSNQSIRAETFTNFGDNFDILVYNRVCQLANGEHKSLFI